MTATPSRGFAFARSWQSTDSRTRPWLYSDTPSPGLVRDTLPSINLYCAEAALDQCKEITKRTEAQCSRSAAGLLNIEATLETSNLVHAWNSKAVPSIILQQQRDSISYLRRTREKQSDKKEPAA